MIDTHAHIQPNEELKINGVSLVILSASNINDSKDNLELAKINKRLLPAIGIHPQEEAADVGFLISSLESLLANNKNIIAIGECGLDFSQESDKINQEALFRGQIELAEKYQKPLIIHSRKAAEEMLSILADYKNIRGVIHCYSGGKKRIKKFLELPGEIYFGIDGNLTYEDGLAEVVKIIPKDRLVLETDSPLLTPIPHRGETNYPEYVKFIYEKTAEIWEMSLAETEKIVDENAKRLFAIV